MLLIIGMALKYIVIKDMKTSQWRSKLQHGYIFTVWKGLDLCQVSSAFFSALTVLLHLPWIKNNYILLTLLHITVGLMYQQHEYSYL